MSTYRCLSDTRARQTTARIEKAVSGCFLFGSLDEDQLQAVILSMEERKVVPGEIVIKQGACAASCSGALARAPVAHVPVQGLRVIVSTS